MRRGLTQLFTAAVLVAGAPIADAKPRTLASGAPACGNVMEKKPSRPCTASKPTTTEARTTRRPVKQKLRALLGAAEPGAVAKPRTFRDGSPANGKVARRTAQVVEFEFVEQPISISSRN